jgi:hypothetical protein
MEPASRPDLSSPLVVGRHVDEVLTILSDADTAKVLSVLVSPKLLKFLEAHPLGRLEFSGRVSEPEFNAEYDPNTRAIVVNTDRPRWTYGQTLRDEPAATVSSLGRDLTDAMSRSLFHELGHHIERSAGPLVFDALKAPGRQGVLYPLTQLARFSPFEYFSESLTAYQFENDALYHRDPTGYTVIENILHRVGLL